MGPPDSQRRRPHSPETPPKGPTEASVTQVRISPATEAIQTNSAADIADCYCVLAYTPDDRQRRRLFLSLHSAVQAVERSKKRGLPAQLILCRLEPVPADLDGEVAE